MEDDRDTTGAPREWPDDVHEKQDPEYNEDAFTPLRPSLRKAYEC